MPKYRVKIRLHATGHVEVTAENEESAMDLADEQVNGDLGAFVENTDIVDIGVAGCEEIGDKRGE